MDLKNFWHDLLPIGPANITFENKTIDVAVKDCFSNYDVTACVRNSVLSFLGFLSFYFCLTRIVKLHVLRHPQIHQYLVFYLASFEVIILIVKWMALMSWYKIEFVASYLKMMQFLLLCHFHWSLVSRILHQRKIINWVIIPLLCVFLCLYTSVTILGLISKFSSWVQCLAPHWLILSLTEFTGIQLYVIAGFYITKKINSVSALDSFKWEQKRDLWSVIAAYECSSIVTLAYYSTLRALGDYETGCSGIFGHAQDIYTAIYATIMIIKYLGPIWIMLFIFFPTRGSLSSEEQRLLGWSYDGSTTSTFNAGARFQDSYRQLILPVENMPSIIHNEYPVLRRSYSSPAFLSKSPLSPISEVEILPPARITVPSYGALDSCSFQPETAVQDYKSGSRCKHDPGMSSKRRGCKSKIVSLNQCSGEVENVTPSSGERA